MSNSTTFPHRLYRLAPNEERCDELKIEVAKNHGRAKELPSNSEGERQSAAEHLVDMLSGILEHGEVTPISKDPDFWRGAGLSAQEAGGYVVEIVSGVSSRAAQAMERESKG